MSCYIGIDLGGSHAAIGLVNNQGEIISTHNIRTPEYSSAEGFVNECVNSIRNLMQSSGVQQINGIGIGAPNGNFFNGSIDNAPNLPWSGFIPLAQLFQDRINVPVSLTNDANAAAIGELQFGIAKAQNIRDFIMITLGTGLGSGIVVNGNLVYGHDGFAGELGHSIVSMDGGRLCKCGKKGCLERYVSATGIVISAKEALSKPNNSILKEKSDNLSALDISISAKNGDSLALQIFDETARVLAFSLANATTVTSPEAFIFFGGLANSGELLLQPLRKYFEEYISVVYAGKVKMLQSSIPENNAAVLGAAALAMGRL
jgi:glucokinase